MGNFKDELKNLWNLKYKFTCLEICNICLVQFCDGENLRDTHKISSWIGYRKISDLFIIPLSKKDAIYEALVKRGKNFKKYAIGHHFLQHSKYKGKKGRVIVDIQTKCSKNFKLYNYVKEDDIKDEELFMCTFKFNMYNIAERKWYLDVNINNLDGIILNFNLLYFCLHFQLFLTFS